MVKNPRSNKQHTILQRLKASAGGGLPAALLSSGTLRLLLPLISRKQPETRCRRGDTQTHKSTEQKRRAQTTATNLREANVTSLCLAELLGGARDDANATWIARGLLGSCHRNACQDSGGRTCQPMLLCASTYEGFVTRGNEAQKRGGGGGGAGEKRAGVPREREKGQQKRQTRHGGRGAVDGDSFASNVLQ